jgi:hypothetical protein
LVRWYGPSRTTNALRTKLIEVADAIEEFIYAWDDQSQGC